MRSKLYPFEDPCTVAKVELQDQRLLKCLFGLIKTRHYTRFEEPTIHHSFEFTEQHVVNLTL